MMIDRRVPSYGDVRPVVDLVTDQECHDAMQFMDTIPHDYAVAQAEADYAEHLLSVTESVGAMLSEERAVDKKKWEARASRNYAERLIAWRVARTLFLEIKAKREAAQIKIEVWRTIHADKRSRDVPEPGRREARRNFDAPQQPWTGG